MEPEDKHNLPNSHLFSQALLINIKPVTSVEGRDDINIDQEELERDTQSLRDELSEMDSVEAIDLVTSEVPAPDGAKPGGDLVEWGSLLVTMASTVAPSIGNTLQAWISRRDNQKIILEIGGDKLEVTNVSDLERSKIIDAWIRSKLRSD